MTIYLIYLCILIVTTIIFIIIKDKTKALNIIGVLTIISSIILIVFPFIIKIIANNLINIVNISVLTNYLFKKLIRTSIILFLIGLSEIIISKYMIILHSQKDPT